MIPSAALDNRYIFMSLVAVGGYKINDVERVR
jgi:hypothetical protein